MRVLIVGAGGFSGHSPVWEMLARRYEVFGGTRTGGQDEAPRPRGDGRSRPDDLPAIPLLPCDVTVSAQVREAVLSVQPDGVVLLAGLSSPPLANADPEQAFEIHVLGVVHVLEAVAALARKSRVAVVTSSEVYGRVGAGVLPLGEESALRPEGIYAGSKAAGDLAASAIAAARRLEVVRLRPFNHTGAGQTRDFVCPELAAQVAAIARGERASLIEVGNIDVERDFCDVRDVARGYAAALERGRAGEAYNLCSGRPTSIRDILATFCELAGVAPEVRKVPERTREREVRCVYGSHAKATAELGWRPEVPLRRTLEDVLSRALEPA
jgi:GDP-4-dehydro-6-deoxy-D-mannose reductase